jgi:putative PIN family toxin of toxin-antitoxin system
MTLRVILDTNVLLSGLLWHGAPHALLERGREGSLILVSSPALLAELAEVIARPQFATILARSNTSPERALAELRALAEVSEPAPLATPVCRDPDDDAVLALAIATSVDLIVSGDRDLLDLQHFQDVAILTPAEALRRIPALT